MKHEKKLFVIACILVFILLGIVSNSSIYHTYYLYFFPGIISLLYAIWLFIDKKQYGVEYTDFEVYLRFFTIIGPVMLIMYLIKTRPKRWGFFLLQALTFSVLMILLLNLSAYLAIKFTEYFY